MPKKLTDILGASLSSQGIQGLQGPQGVQGLQGLQGLQGPIGNVSYQLESDTTPKLIADLDLNGNSITNGTITNCTISNPGVGYTCYAVVEHLNNYAGGGGAFTEGAWRTRMINFEEYDPHNIVTVQDNQIRLVPGTYHFQGHALAEGVDFHHARMYDVENAVGFGTGLVVYTNDASSYASATSSFYTRAVTVTTTPYHRFEVQHRCNQSGSSTGYFGIRHNDINMGYNRYVQVTIYKH